MRTVAALVAAIALCSCEAPHAAYVKADAETYLLLPPYTMAGIQADEALDDAQRQDRVDLLKTWEARIRLNGGFPK